jgi:hypothetical protein
MKTDVQTVAASASNPPPSPLPPPLAAAPSSETTNARTDGRDLIVPVRHARLPLRCIKTNQPVSAQEVRRLTLEWIPPAVWLGLLATPVVFLALYFLFRRIVRVDVPLSAKGAALVRGHRWMAIALLASAVALLVLGWSFHLAALLFLATVVTVVAVITILVGSGALRLIRVEGEEVWLRGASRAFLAALPKS